MAATIVIVLGLVAGFIAVVLGLRERTEKINALARLAASEKRVEELVRGLSVMKQRLEASEAARAALRTDAARMREILKSGSQQQISAWVDEQFGVEEV